MSNLFASVARMSSLRLTTLALALVALLLFAGCGGDDGDDSTASTPPATEATPSLTKEELISQGDAICAEVNAAVGSVGGSEAGVPDEITQVSSLYTGMVERLKDLGEPDDTAGYSEFVAAADELATVEDEVKLASEQADTVALGEAATRAAPALEEFQSAASAYGFESCSEGPSAPPVTGAEGAVPGEEEVAPEGTEEGEVEPEAEEAPETGGEEEAPEAGGTGPGAGGGTEGGGGSSGGIGAG
jgi:hypothetical protein